MSEPIDPIDEVAPTSGVSPHGGAGAPRATHGKPVVGHVVAVQRGAHRDGAHRLDVSVGAEEYAEIIVRVESGPCQDLEDKRVVIYVVE